MSYSNTPTIDDHEIKKRVESIAGKNARVVDCEKKSSFVSEESFTINGVPVKLEGKAGEKIKEALKSGQPPPVELVSELLVQAGIEKNPVQLETTTTVKSSTKTSELSTLRDKNGKLVDEKLKEFEEDDEIQSASVEIWEKDSDQAKKFKKTFEEFKDSMSNMEPFLPPKPLPRTFTSDKTPPKSAQNSPESPNETPIAGANKTAKNGPKRPTSFNAPFKTTTAHNNSMYHFYRLATQQYLDENKDEEEEEPKQQPQRPSEPLPRIPSQMKPLKLDKPIPPPKPTKSKPVVDNLRREANLELPVRVVYETYI